MRNAYTTELPPIGGFIPAPVVIETDGDSAWAAWDSAVRELDARSEDGRARDLFEGNK